MSDAPIGEGSPAYTYSGDLLTDLARRLGLPATDPDVGAAAKAADADLGEACRVTFKPIPADVYDAMVLEVGEGYYRRREQQAGNSQFADFTTGQPVRGPRDALATVWPQLRRYVAPF